MNNNNEEICASDSTIAYSLEPYCEMIHINFVFGPKRNEYEIEVPINALNNEINRPGFKIIPYISTDQSISGIEMQVDLPQAQIPWADGIRQFEKYLKPPHKNNKRITNSPIIPVNLAPNYWLPLYFLTKRFDMNSFRNKLMKINFTTNYCIEILSQIYEMANCRYQFPEIENIVFKSLSSNLDSLPSQSFGGIEMAPAILKILEANPGNRSNPPSIVEWLYNVFSPFAESPKQNQLASGNIIRKIITYLNVNNPKLAFIYWCYCTYFDMADGETVFDQYVSVFELRDNYKLLFYIKFKDLLWFLNHANLEINKTQIMKLIIQWIKKFSTEQFFNRQYHDQRLSESRILFNFSVQNHLLNANQLDGQELCTLLPFVYIFQNPNAELLERFIYKIKMDYYNSAVTSKNPSFSLLSWNVLKSTFSLIHNPIPNERRSNLVDRMRMSFKPIDSIFFHWIFSNRNAVRSNMRLVNMNVINEYFRLPSTDVNIIRSPTRRLMIYDVLTCLPKSREVEDAKRSLFDKSLLKQPFNFDECLNRLLGKTSLQLTIETLEFIRHQIRRSVHKMAIFCSILEKFFIPLPNPRLIEPVNEYSVKTCISIMIRSINKIQNPSNEYINELIRLIKPMITLTFNFLNVNEIINIAKFIPFYELMNGNLITSTHEDYILLYAFSSSSFQNIFYQNRSMNMNNNWKALYSPEIQKQMNLIDWSHISIHSLIKIASCCYGFLNEVSFQFDDEDEISSNLPLVNFKQICQAVYEKWKVDQLPRTFSNNLAIIPPKTIHLYLVDFDYSLGQDNEELKSQFLQMGYDDVKIIFVSEDTAYLMPDDTVETVIVYKNIEKPSKDFVSTKIQNFIHSLFAASEVPIVMNSHLLLQILQECPEEWYNYVGENNKNNCEFIFPETEQITPPPPPKLHPSVIEANTQSSSAHPPAPPSNNSYGNNNYGNYNNNNSNGNNNYSNYSNSSNNNKNSSLFIYDNNKNTKENSNFNANNNSSNNSSSSSLFIYDNNTNNNFNNNGFNNGNYGNYNNGNGFNNNNNYNNYNNNGYGYNNNSNYNSNYNNYNNGGYNYNSNYNYNNNYYNNNNNSYGNNYNNNYNYNSNYNNNYNGNYNSNYNNSNYNNNNNYNYNGQNNFNYGKNYNNNPNFDPNFPVAPKRRNEYNCIQWREPSPTLLPLKKDLIQFPMHDNDDKFFKSIPFYPNYATQNFKAKIEWKNGRIFACSLVGLPISIFNFGLYFNLGHGKADDPLLDFYHTAVSKQTSECLLSLICESFAGVKPIVTEFKGDDADGQ